MAEDWRPFTLTWDDAPLDLSFLYEQEKPAGKHGFLTVQGDRMVFQDGTEGRFWGTCFNSGANFPTHDESEMVARRLAKFGVNIVRFHQMDAEWATPNLFQFNRAKPKDNTRTFDPESIERLDYLIYCLKQLGIYIYLDLLTYRQFRPGDGVDAVDQLGQAAKPYTYFDPKLIALQKEFNRDLWLHTNPYTKLAYKDDPAIALTGIKNESDMFTQPVVLEPYRSRLEVRYREWAARLNLSVDAGAVDFAQPSGQIARFLTEVQTEFFRDMVAYLHEIGVRVPINGTNWSRKLGVLASQVAVDFADSHCYWNFPFWESPQGTQAQPMVGSADNTFGVLSFERLLDRPYFVSEWDHAWPDEWRAESAVAYAAVAAFQGWSGLAIHTYRYTNWGPVDSIGGGTSTINGITYRNHFDAFNDPAKFGLFYHAALLFRRGDVAPAKQSVAIRLGEDTSSWLLKRPEDLPVLTALSEQHRVGMVLPGQNVPADHTVSWERPIVDLDAGEVHADTGQLQRSWVKRIGLIDTPRTKVAYGFLGEGEPISLTGLNLDVKTSFATIALSSLTDDPIESSNTLLLTAVGRSDNTSAEYDADRTHQLKFGHGPILIEPIEAKITLTTTHPNLKVWVISERAQAVTPLPTHFADGAFTFEIGAQPEWNPSTIYYLIKV